MNKKNVKKNICLILCVLFSLITLFGLCGCSKTVDDGKKPGEILTDDPNFGDGLYDKPYLPAETVLKDGLLCDFEAMSDLPWFFTLLYFNNMDVTASINKDAKFVTNGNGSLNLTFKLLSFYDPAIYPSIFFQIPNSELDFSGNVHLKFDVYNLSDVELDYFVQTLNVYSNVGYTYTYLENDSRDLKLPRSQKNDKNEYEKISVDLCLKVDYISKNVPKNVVAIRLSFTTLSSNLSAARLYLDNVRIVKEPTTK